MSEFNKFLISLNLDPAACGSTIMPPKDSSAAVRHRACDECRLRKLACSKDPGGCERCRKEGIMCHYSEQKPMGRPRKRHFIEAMQEVSGDQNNEAGDIEVLPFMDDQFNKYESNEPAEPHYTDMNDQVPAGLLAPDQTRASKVDGGRVVWYFGDRDLMAGPPINFGDLNAAPEKLLLDPLLPLSEASTTSESADSPPQPGIDGPCSCLASMYLSLSALQRFPTDVVGALKVVRDAAAVAASTIWCPKCGSICIENPNPPIEAFQNTMLLGTILPIIANGYQRVLLMIDEETEKATNAGTTKTFQYHDFGGMCPKQRTIEKTMICAEKDLFFNAVEMQPDQWRSTVRALLRVDIYGHEREGFHHKGLKDLVSDMETRQRARHALVDAHIARGGIMGGPGTMAYGAMRHELCSGEQVHGCLQILAMAKVAIDNLVIA